MADWWTSRYCLAVKFFAFTQSPSFLPSPQKLTFIFGRRVASSDWSNWSKWAASPWCTVSGEMDGRKWSEWCGATASGKKAVKLDAIGPKPCPWWPSAKQVECPSWLCWPVRSETKLLIADFRAMLETVGFIEKFCSIQLQSADPGRRAQYCILCSIQNLVQNPKSKIQNPKSKIQNPKSKIQNPKSKIRNPKSKIQNPKSKIQNPKSEIQNPKSKICTKRNAT